MRVIPILACFVLVPSVAAAWGDGGHSIVAEIAQHRLTPHSFEIVQKLLKSEFSTTLSGPVSLSSIASWADDYRDKRKDTTNWHFVDVPIDVEGVEPEDVRYDESRDCKANTDPYGTCLVKAVDEQLHVLSEPVNFNDAASVADHVAALKFVVHLYGDMAQPLHCAHRDYDGGGNGFHVFYSGPKQNELEVRTNLHKAWDSLILADIQWNWNAYVLDLENVWLNGKDEKALVTGTIVDWVNECHQQAVRAYNLVPDDLTLSKKQIRDEKEIADEQLAKAGVRLAYAINKALAPYP